MKPVIVGLENGKFVVEHRRAGALHIKPPQHVFHRVFGLLYRRRGKKGIPAFTGLRGIGITCRQQRKRSLPRAA